MADKLDIQKKYCPLTTILEDHEEHPVFDDETEAFYMCPGFKKKRRTHR